MSHDDDDTLAHIDLSAWDAPPPPAKLADAVIERMGSADAGIAVPVEGPTVPRRAWLVGAALVAAAMLALVAWSLLRSPDPSSPSSGEVAAERARSLALPGVRAELDAGADVRWRRDGDVLRVEQRAGTVAWRVAADRKLVIDAGAALASVEAEGANLRVEVQMNAMDARVIGASALTAAAVAMVTVVVYEGHVGVNRPGQQTVVVAPGSTYQIKPENEPPVVGGGAEQTTRRGKVAVLGLELVDSKVHREEAPVVAQVLGTTLRAAAKMEGPYQLAADADKELVDLKLLMSCENEAPACMAPIGISLGVDALVYGHVKPVKQGFQVDLTLLDVPAKSVKKTGSWLIPTADAQRTGYDEWSVKMYGALVGVTTCDAEALKERGMENINMGAHAAALELFEQSLACKQDPYVVQLAFMESCSSENAAKAKLYYKQLTPAQQQKFAQICIRMNVAYEDEVTEEDTRCDEVSCVLTNYEGACCTKYKKAIALPDGLDRAAISAAIQPARDQIQACGDKAPEGGKLVAKVKVHPAGTVASVSITQSPNRALSACVEATLEKLTFKRTQHGGSFSYPFVFPVRERGPAPAPAICDAEALKEKGMENINMGQHAVALSQFEASLRCKSDPYVIQLAFMEACSSSNSAKAKRYYKLMTPAQQQKFSMICERQNVDYE